MCVHYKGNGDVSTIPLPSRLLCWEQGERSGYSWLGFEELIPAVGLFVELVWERRAVVIVVF